MRLERSTTDRGEAPTPPPSQRPSGEACISASHHDRVVIQMVGWGVAVFLGKNPGR